MIINKIIKFYSPNLTLVQCVVTLSSQPEEFWSSRFKGENQPYTAVLYISKDKKTYLKTISVTQFSKMFKWFPHPQLNFAFTDFVDDDHVAMKGIQDKVHDIRGLTAFSVLYIRVNKSAVCW